MTNLISTLGIQLTNVDSIASSQSKLLELNGQLASGKKSLNLREYSALEAQNLISLDSTVQRREGFLSVINTVSTRIGVYDSSLTGIESIAAQASSVATSNSTYSSTNNASVGEQIQGFMQQISYYLNQQVGDRYIFAGTRYSSAPVVDITTLPALTLADTTLAESSPNLPEYDVDYASSPLASAYVQDAVSIDTTQTLTYGISSDQAGFQEVILGLRYAYSATQDSANYDALMSRAKTLINQGLVNIRSIHSNLASDQTTLSQVEARHTQSISDVKSQIDDIQSVDVNEIAIKINAMQTQIEASFSATAKMGNLSILKYL